MKHFRLTQSTLGQRLAVTKGYVSLMMNDKAPISTSVIEGLIKSFAGLNIHWLLTGEGGMFLEKKEVLQLPSGVMEESPVYERLGVSAGGGLLEALVGRVVALEDRLAELEEEMRRLGEIGKGK